MFGSDAVITWRLESLFTDAALRFYKGRRDAEIDCQVFLHRRRQRVSYFQTMLQLLWTVYNITGESDAKKKKVFRCLIFCEDDQEMSPLGEPKTALPVD